MFCRCEAQRRNDAHERAQPPIHLSPGGRGLRSSAARLWMARTSRAMTAGLNREVWAFSSSQADRASRLSNLEKIGYLFNSLLEEGS